MKFTSSFKIAKRNIRRSPYQALTASSVMFLTFLVVSLFSLLALGSQAILRYYESRPQVIAFFKDETTLNDIHAIETALSQTGKVTNTHYVSKEDALKIYRELNKDNPKQLELVTANILPSSLEISANNPEELGPVADVLKKEPVVEDVVYPADVVQNLSKASRIIRWVGGSVALFSMIFATLIILIVIGFKIRLRRNEIATMKLLGASTWFIRSPFLIEGIIYGLFGALVGWLVSFGVLWYFTPLLENNLGEIHLVPVSIVLMIELLGLDLVIAFLIGAVGSYGAVRRYLNA